jgi:glycosyltransferase involved in cell wall biosynthesis
MNILQVISTLNPAAGGPVETAIQQSEVLTEMGHRVHTVSLDAPGSWVDVRLLNKAVSFMGPAIFSYGFSRRLGTWLRANAASYDIIIIHGLWQYHGYCVRKIATDLGVPYVVFLHGMLDPWFKGRYPLKHLKKWLYWPWGEYRVLRDARFALSITADELTLSRHSFWLYKVREVVVGLGIRSRSLTPLTTGDVFLDRYPQLRGKRILLYLSRIHPKKGCDLLIRSFATVARSDDRLHLVIAGPDETGWSRRLVDDSRAFGIVDRITYTGMIRDELKWGAYDAADVFVLPSHQENFGVVVAEALASGLPVLTTYKVNVWREIESSKAGLIDSDTQAGINRLLTRWLALSTKDAHRMRECATACFATHFEIHRTSERLLGVLQEAIEKPHSDYTYSRGI